MTSREAISEFLGREATDLDCEMVIIQLKKVIDIIILDTEVRGESDEAIHVPRYVAEKIREEGGAVIKEDDIILVLKQSLQRERMHSELGEVDDLFYKRLARQLEREGDEDGSIRAILNEFVRSRCGKILLLTGIMTEENRRRMSVEEREFSEKTASAMKEYVGGVINDG